MRPVYYKKTIKTVKYPDKQSVKQSRQQWTTDIRDILCNVKETLKDQVI